MKQLINKLVQLELLTVDDVRGYSTLDLIYQLINRVNDITTVINGNQKELALELEELEIQLNRIINEDLTLEVEHVLQQWLDDGVFDDIVDKVVLNAQESRIQALEHQITTKPTFTEENTCGGMLGAFFVSSSDTSIHLYHSPDGVHFHRATEKAPLVGRDPSILYYKGKYYIAITSYNPHDFVIYETKNLVDFTPHYISAGLLNSNSQATKLWAFEFFQDGDDIYGIVSLRRGAEPNIKGTTVDSFDTYLVKMDMERMEATSARKLELDNGNKIDGAIIKNGDLYYLFIKDEYDLNIEIWTSPNLVDFTKQIDKINAFLDKPVEGCTVAKKGDQFYLYCDAFYEPYVYVSKSSDLLNWATCEPIRCDSRTRHGGVITITDPNAKMVLNDLIISNQVVERSYAKIMNLGSLAENGVIAEFNPYDTFLYQSFKANGDIVINKVGNLYNSKSFSVVLRSGAEGSITIKNGGKIEMNGDLVIKPSLGNADVILNFEWVDELGKFKPLFLNTEKLLRNQAVCQGYTRIYLDNGDYASGSTITLTPSNGALYTVGGEFAITINGISEGQPGDRIFLGVFSASQKCKIILQSGTNLNIPGGSYEISVAKGNNEKIIELVKCYGTGYRLKG